MSVGQFLYPDDEKSGTLYDELLTLFGDRKNADLLLFHCDLDLQNALSLAKAVHGNFPAAMYFLEKFSVSLLDECVQFISLPGTLSLLKRVPIYANVESLSIFAQLLNGSLQLVEWLARVIEWKQVSILYDTNIHEKTSIDFHAKCDKKGPTISMLFGKNFICGGVTFVSWLCSGQWLSDEKAFLFSLINAHGKPPQKFNVKQSDCGKAVYDRQVEGNAGPIFGLGCDLGTQFVADSNFKSRIKGWSKPSSFSIEEDSLFEKSLSKDKKEGFYEIERIVVLRIQMDKSSIESQ